MKMEINNLPINRKYQSMVNNAQGHLFEQLIDIACKEYSKKGIAKIEKIPEPFRVLEKNSSGRFRGQFTKHAQPDFCGTLKNGQAIVFEAKFTTTDRMNKNVLSDEQIKSLEEHSRLGAITGVCVGIKDDYFFIPYDVWKDMKKHFGHSYVTAEDIRQYKVRFKCAIMFLDNIIKSE
jgi:recombination protein U